MELTLISVNATQNEDIWMRDRVLDFEISREGYAARPI